MEDLNKTTRDRAQATLRAAWVVYFVFMVLPPLAFAIALLVQMNRTASPRNSGGVTNWLWVIVAYLVVGFPAALFIRRRVCIAYNRGESVAPRNYFVGMLTVWVSLEIGMFLPIVGYCVTGVLMPIIPLALVPLVFFFTLWPSGDMLVSHSGDSDDAETYKNPR
jgi:hypothetical protein